MDLNLNDLRLLAGIESNLLIKSFEVLRRCGGVVAGADTYDSADTVFVYDSYLSVVISFGYRHVDAAEAETIVLLIRFE